MFGKNKGKLQAVHPHSGSHEQNIMRRSEYARVKMVQETPHVPFNAEHHSDVYIPKLHQGGASSGSGKADGTPQSVRIGFGCAGDVDPEILKEAGMSVGQKPAWGKKRTPKTTSEDILVGGILVPQHLVHSARAAAGGPQPISLNASGNSFGTHETGGSTTPREAIPVCPVDRGNWTGKKASPLKSIVGAEIGAGASFARKPEAYNADTWGHGSGGYHPKELKDALAKVPPPREPNNVFP